MTVSTLRNAAGTGRAASVAVLVLAPWGLGLGLLLTDAGVGARLGGRAHYYRVSMGRRNYLVEGVSGTGKTSVCEELQRRGRHAVHGDRELAYRGDPVTGAPVEVGGHEHHLWRVEVVEALVADQVEPVTFFCGGSRNFPAFIDLFDGVFVLQVDLDTLTRRLEQRPEGEWGAESSERELVVRLHRSGEGTPDGTVIDATLPIARVVDQILAVVARDHGGSG